MVPVINIGFDASILYSQQGFKIKEDFKTNTLDIPVNLKYKISALDILGIYFAVGPYASFKFSEDPDDLMESKSFGAGLNFGLGIDLLGSMQVGAGYKLGLTDDYGVAKDNPLAAISNFKGKQRGWTISAAYLF
jgi:hypothetical protein